MGKLLSEKEGRIDLFAYTLEEFDQMCEQGNAFAEMIVEEGRIVYDKQKEK